MDSPGLVILAILAIGGLFILLPVALVTLSEHRRPKSVVCPETGGPASVAVDAGRAARGAIFGRLRLYVQTCSLWPEKSGCAQGCLTPPAAQSAPADKAQA
jgi:hypothetical protein